MFFVCIYHSWASTSRPMLPTQIFRHPASQSGTVAFRYRSGVPLFRYRTVRYPAFHKDRYCMQLIQGTAQLTGCWVVQQGTAQLIQDSVRHRHSGIRISLVMGQSGIAQLWFLYSFNSLILFRIQVIFALSLSMNPLTTSCESSSTQHEISKTASLYNK